VLWHEEAPADAACFGCPRCRLPWSEDGRRLALRQGVWVPGAEAGRARGYHLSQLLSPVARAAELASQWLAGRDHGPSRQVFCNSVLGLPHVEEGDRLDDRLFDLALARGGGAVMAPAAQGSVAGIDVGSSWLHVVVAEPAGNLLRVIRAVRLAHWAELVEVLGRFRVESFVIDAMPETHQARELLRSFPQGWLCYYRPPGSAAVVEQDARVVRVGRTDSLDAMFRRWREGRIALPRDVPEEFRRHLKAPVRVVRAGRDGRVHAEYAEEGAADHYAHALNYCELALGLRPGPLTFAVTLPAGPGRVAW
jgi:hypothetical protein